MRTSTMTELFIEGELPRPNRQPNALVIDVLIDPGDQTDDLICPVTKLKVKIETGLLFWSRPKYLVVHQVSP